MNLTDYLGILAGTLTTIASIPQLVQVIKTKSTKDISLPMFISFSIGVLCWFIYGLLTNAFPVILANAMVFIMAISIIAFKIKYK